MYFQDAVMEELKTIDSIPSSLITTGGLKIYTTYDPKAQESIESTIKETITNKLKSAEQHFKQYKYDVIFCNDRFYKLKTKEYKDYLKNLPEGEEFIESVIFNYKIDIVKGS